MNAPPLFLSPFQGELGGGTFVVSKCHTRKSVGIYLRIQIDVVRLFMGKRVLFLMKVASNLSIHPNLLNRRMRVNYPAG